MNTWFLVYLIQIQLEGTMQPAYTHAVSVATDTGFETKKDCEEASHAIRWDGALQTYCIEQKHHKKNK